MVLDFQVDLLQDLLVEVVLFVLGVREGVLCWLEGGELDLGTIVAVC